MLHDRVVVRATALCCLTGLCCWSIQTALSANASPTAACSQLAPAHDASWCPALKAAAQLRPVTGMSCVQLLCQSILFRPQSQATWRDTAPPPHFLARLMLMQKPSRPQRQLPHVRISRFLCCSSSTTRFFSCTGPHTLS